MNKLKSLQSVSAFLLFFSVFCAAQIPSRQFPELEGDYLAQRPPGLTAEIFAPGIICTGMNERDVAISSDGSEFYYGLSYGRTVTILCSRRINGKWSEPREPSFAADYNYFFFEPCISNDGQRIFFLSNMPPAGKQAKPGWAYQNIWASDRQADGSWGAPYNPDTNINNGQQQYFPSVTRTGTMYFTRVDNESKKPQIYRSRYLNGKFQPAEKLPEKINGFGEPFNSCISPDESFLIACVDKAINPDNPNKTNYYLFFRDSSDNWSDGQLLPSAINIRGSNAMSASVSPDMKYLFFAAQKNERVNSNTLSQFREAFEMPLNGSYDIFWIDLSVIQKMRNTNSKK